jgi:5-(carboxyamino)imidazole ribonucleotide synthase
MASSYLKQGSTIGILGGGQLGRMIAMACVELGYRSLVFCPDGDNPAAEVASEKIIGNWNNDELLKKFISMVDAVTLEFENIPIQTIKKIEKYFTVYPNSKVLEIAQNRPLEKKYAKEAGIRVPRWWLIKSTQELKDAIFQLDGPGILKTTSFGYDGKGQLKISGNEKIEDIWFKINDNEVILEEFVDFKTEVSFLICRKNNNDICIFPPTENFHQDGILKKSVAPAELSEEVWLSGAAHISKLAQELLLNGIMAVEFFLLHNGQLVFNEIAPRPHNSFHWTMDGLLCSQFNQLIRCVVGMPFGNVSIINKWEMINILSENHKDIQYYTEDRNSKIYIYNKQSIKTKRKLGHINRLIN